MFSAVKPVIFTLDVQGFPRDLQVLEFRAREALNQPYEVNLELVGERRDLDIKSLHHRSAFLRFGADGSGIHGQVYTVAEGDSGKRLTRYQMTLVPHLTYLSHCHNQRIFQNLSVPQIIAKVLKDQGMQADTWRFQLNAEYRPRLYCVQYETDMHFLQRLCEEEGLHFHFQHSAEGHVLVFGDDQTSFGALNSSRVFNTMLCKMCMYRWARCMLVWVSLPTFLALHPHFPASIPNSRNGSRRRVPEIARHRIVQRLPHWVQAA